MENFTKMLNAQLILLIYMAVGMYCMKVHIINQETKKKLVDLILKITLPCMIFNSFNKPLTPEVLMQTALILVVAFCISILSFSGKGDLQPVSPGKEKHPPVLYPGQQLRISGNAHGRFGLRK